MSRQRYSLCLILGFLLPFSAYSETTLRVGITSFPTSLGNPYNTTSGLPSLYTHAVMFEGLTRVGGDAVPIPMLAVKWEMQTDNSWLFYIRKGATFSNGEAVNAYAVSKSFDILQTDIGKTYNVASEVSGIAEIEVVDEYAVRVHTFQPDILLPHKIAALKIVPPKYWANVGADRFARNPIGSGPFYILDWSSSSLQFKKFTQSWRTPKLDQIELVAAAEASTRVQGLLSGRLDIAVQLGPDEISIIEASGHQVFVGVDPSMQVLAFITTKNSPLQDIRVRQALNYAVDRKNIAEGLLGGHVKMATQTAPSFAFGFDPLIPLWPYDPAKAKDLLRQAGYPNGFSFTGEILLGAASYSHQVYQQVASDLSKIGVELTLRLIPAAQYARGVYQGDWAGTAVGMDYGANPTLDALTPLVRHSCRWMAPWFCDRSILPLIYQAEAAINIEERRLLTQKVMRYQHSLSPAIFLYETARFDALSSKVNGFNISVGHINYDEISFDN